MNRKRKSEQRLDDIYASIPVTIECKGLCQDSCGPIAMTADEFRRISEVSETVPSINGNGTCSLLVDGKCSVYEVRPTICRLWGMTMGMICPFGCRPTPKYLTREEGFVFLRKADKVTGRKEMKATLEGLPFIDGSQNRGPLITIDSRRKSK